MKHLRRGTEKQGTIIEINIFAEDDYLLIPSQVPYLGISGPQKILIDQMFSVMPVSSQPAAKMRWKIRINKKFHLLNTTSRCAACRAAYSRHASISALSK